MQSRQQEKRYTVRDYKSWNDGKRWELIDGIAYDMSPAPRTIHQAIVREVMGSLGSYLKGKTCTFFGSPIDVYFSEDEDADDVVVQPDVLVVCDPSKIREHGIVGAPDIAVEVLSPRTAGYDFVQKLQLYQRKGVKEYWIVSPDEKMIFQNVLENGVYKVTAFASGNLTSALLPEYALDVQELFRAAEVK